LRLERQRQVWLIPIADERVGVLVKLWNPLRTRAIPEPERFCSGDSLTKRRYIKCMDLLPLDRFQSISQWFISNGSQRLDWHIQIQ